MKNNVWTNEGLTNKSYEDFGLMTWGGPFGGNFDRQMAKAVEEFKANKEKSKIYDPKEPTKSYFLSQEDNFFTPNDLPI